jgi:hypothetical protein
MAMMLGFPSKKKIGTLDFRRAGEALSCWLVWNVRCLVPAIDGAYFSRGWKEALWDRFYTGAPRRQRRFVERYNGVKRA